MYTHATDLPSGCGFRIAVDDSGSVVETNEYNDYVWDGYCVG